MPNISRTPPSGKKGKWITQSVLLDMTSAEARKWLKEHDFIAEGLEKTGGGIIRARQYNPGHFSAFRIQKISGSVKFILGKVK